MSSLGNRLYIYFTILLFFTGLVGMIVTLQPSPELITSYPVILTVIHTYALDLQHNPLYGIEFISNFGDTILIERNYEFSLYKLLEEGDNLLMHTEETGGVVTYSDGFIELRRCRMNDQLQSYANIMDRALVACREELKRGLSRCTDEQKQKFKLMYTHKLHDVNINDVVNAIPPEKLDWAMQQVERTLIRNNTVQEESNENSKH